MTRELVEMSLAEMREVQLEILDQVDRFCRDHGLRYYLWAGTLLGAVRHGGYIPWDDDIDLAMPRPDFERFCRDFSTDAGHLIVSSLPTSEGHWLPFAKVADTRTVVDEPTRIPVSIGVNVDIFPLDGWPSGSATKRVHRTLLRLAHRFTTLWWHRGDSATMPAAKRAVLSTVQRLPMRWNPRLTDRIARAHRYDSSGDVGVQVMPYREMVERSAYGEPVEVEFEGRRFLGPEQSDRVLSNLFGDYMQLPPEDQRKVHGLTARRL